jgi:hypothetical protein
VADHDVRLNFAGGGSLGRGGCGGHHPGGCAKNGAPSPKLRPLGYRGISTPTIRNWTSYLYFVTGRGCDPRNLKACPQKKPEKARGRLCSPPPQPAFTASAAIAPKHMPVLAFCVRQEFFRANETAIAQIFSNLSYRPLAPGLSTVYSKNYSTGFYRPPDIPRHVSTVSHEVVFNANYLIKRPTISRYLHITYVGDAATVGQKKTQNAYPQLPPTQPQPRRIQPQGV